MPRELKGKYDRGRVNRRSLIIKKGGRSRRKRRLLFEDGIPETAGKKDEGVGKVTNVFGRRGESKA